MIAEELGRMPAKAARVVLHGGPDASAEPNVTMAWGKPEALLRRCGSAV